MVLRIKLFVAGLVLAAQPFLLMTAKAEGWMHYGGGLDGARYADSDIVTPATIGGLKEAWRFRTGDSTDGEGYFGKRSSFKATPILVDGKLVFSTGFNRIIALDPETGAKLWRFDPDIDFSIKYSEMFTSRGVAAWSDPEAEANAKCATRIYLGTLDARLISIDAADGALCETFGTEGEIDLSKGIPNYRRGEYSVTSPPTVVNGVVVVGSSIGDNGGVSLDHGVVRAYDARSGELRWQWDPVPRFKNSPGAETWENKSAARTGAANVWSVMAADEARDLIFLPTTSPSPDFYGGRRLGDNNFANSIVAIKASNGEVAWAYQIVRHDLWDYDLASQPMLLDVDHGDAKRPALILATKMGFVFVLDRETGEPIFPVTERPVPPSDVPGERAARTQRVPSISLHPTEKNDIEIWIRDDAHTARCQEMLAGVRYEGIFTPPSLEGTLVYPGNPGGVNWGSMAAQKEKYIAFVAVNRLPTVVKLIARKEYHRQKSTGKVNGVDAQFTSQSGTPFGIARYELFNDESGAHCLKGPWSTLVAININNGSVLWEAPAGRAPGIDDDDEAAEWGFFAIGGPMATKGGVVFHSTTFDQTLRGYDTDTGKVIWSAQLPAGAHATPMSYEIGGAQYVVITAGGALANEKGQGDYVVAYKLARQD